MVAFTSSLAYYDIVLNGQEKRQCDLIIEQLEVEPSTIRELAAKLGWWPSTVSARLNELRRQGLVTASKFNTKRKCKISGRLAFEWSLE